MTRGAAAIRGPGEGPIETRGKRDVAQIVLSSTFLIAPSAQAQRMKVLNIAAKEPDTLDPHSSTIGQSRLVGTAIANGLLPTSFLVPPVGGMLMPALVVAKPISPCGIARTA